jgi:hypothetical protein
MSRPISRTLLEHVTVAGPGPYHINDTESFTTASVQFVYTGKRVTVLLKGRLEGSPVESILKRLDSLTCASGCALNFDDLPKLPGTSGKWPVGISEVWAEVTAIDSGEVSLYFVGCERAI